MLLDLLWVTIVAFNIVALLYFTILNGYYLTTSLFSFRALRGYSRRLKSVLTRDLAGAWGAPPVTVLVPAYNEAQNIADVVRSLLGLEYPEYEIMVVNDGSTDGTLDVLKSAYLLEASQRNRLSPLRSGGVRGIYRSASYPHLWVIDKPNGGKADALNVGLEYCRTPLFCSLDADSALDRDALLRLVRPFLEDSDTIAAGGIVRVANGSRFEDGHVTDVRLPSGWLARLQVLEYLRAFLAGRVGWSSTGVLLIVSGAFGMYRRELVVAAGGYSPKTVGEDMELIVRLHRFCRQQKRRYNISFVPDPVAWTEVPESLRTLARQRDRWQRGLMQSMSQHRTMMLNPKYGRIGMIAFPYFWLMEGFGPAVETLGYVAFVIAWIAGWVAPEFVIAFLVLALLAGIVLSAAAVMLEELVFHRYTRPGDFTRLLLLSLVENLGYRQFLTFCRFRGLISAVRGRMSWGELQRRGALHATPPEVARVEPVSAGGSP